MQEEARTELLTPVDTFGRLEDGLHVIFEDRRRGELVLAHPTVRVEAKAQGIGRASERGIPGQANGRLAKLGDDLAGDGEVVDLPVDGPRIVVDAERVVQDVVHEPAAVPRRVLQRHRRHRGHGVARYRLEVARVEREVEGCDRLAAFAGVAPVGEVPFREAFPVRRGHEGQHRKRHAGLAPQDQSSALAGDLAQDEPVASEVVPELDLLVDGERVPYLRQLRLVL